VEVRVTDLERFNLVSDLAAIAVRIFGRCPEVLPQDLQHDLALGCKNLADYERGKVMKECEGGCP
jgi:hypothetical protein